jgi:hypothetical protein
VLALIADRDPLVQFETEVGFVGNNYLFTFDFPTTTLITLVESPVEAAPDEEDRN